MWQCVIQLLFPKDLEGHGTFNYVDQVVKEEQSTTE